MSAERFALKQLNMATHWTEFAWLKIFVQVLTFMLMTFQDSAQQSAPQVKILLEILETITALRLAHGLLEITCTKTHRPKDVSQAVLSTHHFTRITERNLVWPFATIQVLLLRPPGLVKPIARTTFIKMSLQENVFQTVLRIQFQSIFTQLIQRILNASKYVHY